MLKGGSLTKVATRRRELKDYKNLIPPELYGQILATAKRLRGLRIAEINATKKGGGVAELLESLIPLFRSLGLKVSWYVLPRDQEFFEVTKFIHNTLQGKRGELSKRQKAIYLAHTERFSRDLAKIKADIFVVHDPQPLASIHFLNGAIKPAIWRCHLDLSNPNPHVWKFLRPFIVGYDRLVFSMPEYVPKGIPQKRVSIFTPTIDPFNAKNANLSMEKAREIVSFFGIDLSHPLITQVSRFDLWKDPLGVVSAYKIAKRKIPELQLALVGELASDDPEGEIIYREVKKEALSDPDIYLLCLPHSDMTINAFQRVSDVIIQKSIREGFGLTVTEAMWKGKAVIGGNVGGIKYQIEDSKSGILVSDYFECAHAMVTLIKNPALRKKMGEMAKERVRENFLMPRKVLDWLGVFEKIISETLIQKPQRRPPLALSR